MESPYSPRGSQGQSYPPSAMSSRKKVLPRLSTLPFVEKYMLRDPRAPFLNKTNNVQS